MQKLYYSISEAGALVNEESHVLRYWEKEFAQLNPRKNSAGNRIYSKKDILTLKAIKYLIREKKMSMKGAVEVLNESDAIDEKFKEKIDSYIGGDAAPTNGAHFTYEEIKELYLILSGIRELLK